MKRMQETLLSRAFSRREFVAFTGAAGLTAAAAPAFAQQAPAGPKIRLGVVGCGGRGRFIMELFRKHGGYEIAAVADYFRDRVDEAGAGSRGWTGTGACSRRNRTRWRS